ncbi:MAG: hypothetical protein ABIS92_06240 [Polyangia bacterium]
MTEPRRRPPTPLSLRRRVRALEISARRALALWLGTVATVMTMVTGQACVGGHFVAQSPATQLGKPTQVLVDRIAAERAARNLRSSAWVADLHPAAARAAVAVVRGELALKPAAHLAAQEGVTALGRHVWSFVADCSEGQQFRPPAMTWGDPLLYATAVATAPGRGGHTTVVLLIAEPGTSALRADQMGGGRGGSNPVLETYVHPSVATGPCGESWPATPPTPL